MSTDGKLKYNEALFKALFGLMKDIQEAEAWDVVVECGVREVQYGSWYAFKEPDGSRSYTFKLRGLPTTSTKPDVEQLGSEIVSVLRRKGVKL